MRDRISRGAGSAEAGLCVIACLSALRGMSYIPPFVDPSRAPTHWLEALLPSPWWSILWLGLAVLCVVAVLWRQMIVPVVGAVISVHTLWGLSFLLGTTIGDVSRGWVSALGYFAVAALTAWGFGRGRAGEIRLKEG